MSASEGEIDRGSQRERIMTLGFRERERERERERWLGT